MIFSLATQIRYESLSVPENEFHSFVFFSYPNSIDLSRSPQEIIPSMLSSLRMKKGILIIDFSVSGKESFSFNRGLRSYEGRGFIYLAPHGLSLLRPFSHQTPLSFASLKTVLVESNLLK